MTLATINPGEVDYEDGGSGFQVWASGFRGQVSIDSYSTKQFSDSHPACHAAYNKFSHVYMCVYIYIHMYACVYTHVYKYVYMSRYSIIYRNITPDSSMI